MKIQSILSTENKEHYFGEDILFKKVSINAQVIGEIPAKVDKCQFITEAKN